MGYKKTDKCIEKAYDDERLFVLMARDPQAPEVIIKWIAHSLGNQPDNKIREALECAIEMQKTGHIFRERKEQEEKEKAAAREREEFERWRKGNAIKGTSDKAVINERGRELMGYEETKQKIAHNYFAQVFANWLDAQDHDTKEAAISNPHGFAKIFDTITKLYSVGEHNTKS
jgi:hypothetical protein